jgi:hypothetical protein
MQAGRKSDRCGLKICEADPVPPMNQAPAAGPVGELALPGGKKHQGNNQ